MSSQNFVLIWSSRFVPPGLHTGSSSRATSFGRGANIAPTRLVTTSKLAS